MALSSSKILHLIAPDKEQEFLNIIAANRQRIERERIVMPNDEKISQRARLHAMNRL